MIDEKQRLAFAERGLIRLPGLLPEAVLAPARQRVYRAMTAAGGWRNGAWVGTDDGAKRRPRGKRNELKACSRTKEFRSLLTAEVLAAARELAGGRPLQAMVPYPQLLFTAPNAERWTVPHSMWHLDVPRLGEAGAPGVQMFTFLDPVARGGGGTLLVAGSHRLLNDAGALASRNVKRRLRRLPYFRELMNVDAPHRERFAATVGHAGDVPLQVVELVGEPGDVYFTDLRLLHSLGPNASRRPRIMATQRLLLAAAAAQVGDVYAEIGAQRRRRRQPPVSPPAASP